MFKGKYRIPGPKSKELLKISEKYEAHCMNQQAPIVWDHAEGVTVTDVDGNTYIDLTSGVLVTNVGHSHPVHVARIQRAAGHLMNCYDFPTPERVMAAQGIAKLMPRNLNRVFMLTTGSEATSRRPANFKNDRNAAKRALRLRIQLWRCCSRWLRNAPISSGVSSASVTATGALPSRA